MRIYIPLNTIPIPLFAGSTVVTSLELIIIEPLVGISNPAIILSNVDFPHPDGPTITQKSPR